jgi:hypothetical protein
MLVTPIPVPVSTQFMYVLTAALSSSAKLVPLSTNATAEIPPSKENVMGPAKAIGAEQPSRKAAQHLVS